MEAADQRSCKMMKVTVINRVFQQSRRKPRILSHYSTILFLFYLITESYADNYITSNPYYSGCLHQFQQQQQQELQQTRHGEHVNLNDPTTSIYYNARVCNSNDELPEAVEMGYCRLPEFPEYNMEIRIATGNWDSATMLGWLAQILLSEILGVPSTIESGMYGSSRDFYDINGAIDYDTSMGSQPLATAAGYGDCRNVPPPTNKSGADYIPCAHFYPEFWGEAIPETQDQKIEPSQSTGFLGFETWFMTKFTADEYPQFVSYHGLQKKEYQQLLAETFKRPTTWKDYCELISKDNCTTPDDVAQRSPLDEEEATKMFAPDPTTSSSLLYTGHFRYTNKNNCTLWPSNCTGHIANYPCGWSSNMESNLYHLNIALDSKNGPNGEPNGYTESQLKEMWHAANATRSHLMMQWWSPEPLYQQYLGTDAEMQRVTLKPYTRECALARAEWKDECASDIETRVGSPEEACGDPVEPLRKLITKGLYETLTSPEIPIEAQSPAYDVLRFFSINEIQLGELFDAWHSARTPRDGVCKWAVENLDDVLKVMIPPTYPRVTEEEPHSAFGFVTLGVGVLATLLVVLTGWMVYRQRYVPSIRYAQVDFLSILLFGSFLVGIGSVLLSTPASDGTCLSSKWLVNLGYTLELVPLILKVGAINKMMQAARELRRITIRRDILYKSVAAISLCVLVYLAIWSAIDPPQQVAEYSMTGSTTATGEYIVGKTYYCSNGASAAWQFAAVAWNAILLMCASVLAFQTRNVLQTFNESRTLAFLIYSHFIFVLARISIIFLSGHVKGSILDYSLSLIYSLDQMAACCIYFVPKLLTTTDEDISDLVSRDTLSHGNSRRFSTGMLDTLQKMKVLENSSDLLKIENTKGAIIEELRDLDRIPSSEEGKRESSGNSIISAHGQISVRLGSVGEEDFKSDDRTDDDRGDEATHETDTVDA